MRLLSAALAALAALPPLAPAVAQDRTLTLGAAGLLDRRNRQELPPLTLSSGKPLADAPIELVSGGYYTLTIVADGTAELAVAGPEFFRAVWVNEVVVNDIEVRPLGVDSLEFDDEGEATISFVAVRPGAYTLRIPGSTGETQKVDVVIR